MKVTATWSPTENTSSVKRYTLRITLVIALIASIISFALAWTVKGEFARQGGIRAALEKWAHSHGNLALNRQQSYLDLLKAPYYMLKPVELPQLVVDIKFKNFQKLQEKRRQAISKGLLVTGKDDFVPAKIRHNGETTSVKLRLKGDLLDHIKGDKWSFRVKVKGKDHLFGMRVFSIQNPSVRGFQGGALFYATLQHYGVMAPRYKLVQLIVNGNDMGIMSIEEHFSKEMLESSGRKESVIIRFDESLVWNATDGRKHAGLGGHFDNYHIAEIDAFGTKKIAKSTRLKKDFKIAVGLLRAFESGEMAPSEVFDAELMGRYIAVSELWGSWHSFSWRNLRFYYNPITAKLEPIGYDPDIQTRSQPGSNNAQAEPITSVMRSSLLDDPVIYAEFKNAVHLIRNDIQNGSLLSALAQIQDEYLQVLRKEFFFLQPFDQTELEKRISLLENYNKNDLDRLYQISYSYPELLQAYAIDSRDGLQIELANITPSILDVVSINWVSDKGDGENFSAAIPGDVIFPMMLPPMPRLGKLSHKIIHIQNPSAEVQDYHLEVSVKIRGTYKTENVRVIPYYSTLQNNPVPESSLQQQALLHKKYLVTHASTGTMTIKPGTWKVLAPIVVPKGSTLNISAATTLRFSPNTGIISHGALEIQGAEHARVKLQGIGTDSWQGVAVMNAAGESLLLNTDISAAQGMAGPAWNLTGGVTFYKSNVTIRNSLIEDSRGEDALNIIHSRFLLDNVKIKNTLSDAFDADFSTGNVTGGLYQDIGLAGGGDAIDVSGSQVSIANTRFINIDDKAISAGERSQVIAKGLDINSAGTAAASKDASTLEISNSKIYHARIAGLMAYTKKPEYGPGRIISSGMDFGTGFSIARAQKGSYVSIDDKPVKVSDFDVKEMYKTIMKPGLRK